ncbi:tetratricopeptide repeat protein [Kordiimonas aquimaris]|uniref:tetratricopeptide repeat protein n=1 Tax=Kordiimonas aquimaris TaxID=707591 RepID=UPI0021D36D02|nr:tetratricopeptide repeat protein [Kordiimonas aquimaris]
MSDLNSDLLTQEVDDEVRSERMKQLWSAYGKYLIGLAVGIVIIVGGREAYTAYVQSKEEASSTAFEAARDASSIDGIDAAQAWTDALPDLEGGYKTIGRMRIAAAAAKDGNITEAVAAYDAIAADASADESLRSLAQLFAGMLITREGTDYEDARSRLSVVAIKGEPWYYSALEQLALVDLETGDQEAALSGFKQLTDDPETPQAIRARAQELRSALEKALGVDPIASVDVFVPDGGSQ